jgi:class 3 adenylate cyclase/tetratricopeptide (TPR) repeat protein
VLAVCPNCGAQNRAEDRFCRNCGTALALTCPTCGSPVEAGDLFCGSCGSRLQPTAVPTGAGVAGGPPSGGVAERRLVSVVFVDLVGFTSLSETRDAEEVRELLTRYFESARRLIGLYGGTVEKFIGDAVMAVWGTPAAREDDAERAVRAALDLVAAVAELGAEVGAPDLRARAGVVTGEAAVTIGATQEGMVAGDLVNTASRVQDAAPPGQVFVAEATRRATEAAIAYEDAGEHELKGKLEPIRLFRAVRVVATRGGALRSIGLEAPFVGRDRELRLSKELYHASAEDGKAHLLSVVGIAGVGKSRLSWEFFKYLDGLVDTAWWHRGRCLAYGEGVTYWALAEMVRMRARIAEEEAADSALAKLQATVEEVVTDPEERAWIEPRLSHLLGLEERANAGREDLFSGWRLFFERLADRGPVVMVFEDLQWADDALLAFIEYLLEWSRNHPLFVITLARPELADRRPNWGSGSRNFTSLGLEPLSDESMEELLRGLVPGLPDDLRHRIRDRAEGVPLYAVETVRMLIDRGLLRQEGAAYALAGPVAELDVPETLHALIAARLDGLAPEERTLLQYASVLGKTFTVPALAALTDRSVDAVQPLLESLMRKEVLGLQTDPRSPERGQYGFLQALVRKVAYDTLSKRDRKARHLATARYLEANWAGDEDEIVQIVASHYLDAYAAFPEAPDAPEIKAKAREALAAAGRRAQSLAAHEEAQRYFERAAELAEDDLIRAELLENAGEMAWVGGRGDHAVTNFEAAIRLFESNQRTHPAARVAARMVEALWDQGHIDQAIERMEEAFEVLAGDEEDADLATLAAQLGRLYYFKGDFDLVGPKLELALEIAERLVLPEVLSQALNTKAIFLEAKRRREEALALLRHALELALKADVPSAAFRAYFNLLHSLRTRDRYAEARDVAQEGLAFARKLGNRYWEQNLTASAAMDLYMTGEWDRALADLEGIYRAAAGPGLIAVSRSLVSYTRMLVGRGEIERAERHIAELEGPAMGSGMLERIDHASGEAILLRAKGDPAAALRALRGFVEKAWVVGFLQENVREGLVEAVESAVEIGDLGEAEGIVARLEQEPASALPTFLLASRSRLRAIIDATKGDHQGVGAAFQGAADAFRTAGIPFWLAVTLTQHAEWLAGQRRAAEAGPLLDEAYAIFERLGAAPWLERLGRVVGRQVSTSTGA